MLTAHGGTQWSVLLAWDVGLYLLTRGVHQFGGVGGGGLVVSAGYIK